MTANRSQIGSAFAAAVTVEASVALTCGTYGLSDGAVYQPDTSAYDRQISDLRDDIHTEEQAIHALENARPTTDPIIAQVQSLIGQQKGEISTVEQQKTEAVAAVHPHVGEHWVQDGAIGVLVVTLIMAGWVAYRKHKGLGIVSEYL